MQIGSSIVSAVYQGCFVFPFGLGAAHLRHVQPRGAPQLGEQDLAPGPPSGGRAGAQGGVCEEKRPLRMENKRGPQMCGLFFLLFFSWQTGGLRLS